MDPKVEYKREGMRLFEQMWNNICERTTDLIFRMESLNENFVRSTWVEPKASHDAPPPTFGYGNTGTATETQQAASDSQNRKEKLEPLRNVGKRVGRNDPCPCGSGKKYKVCCGRH
jgi:preprotein translocase subunit SecA